MARSLCPDRQRASIALLALILLPFSSGSLSQISAIIVGGMAGLVFCRGKDGTSPDILAMPVSRCGGIACRGVFFALLALSFAPVTGRATALFDAFYRSGALVFGGGHVVLPLLRDAVVVPGWTSDGTFLADYGAAQAVPGSLFTFSAYVGAVAHVPPGGVAGAALAMSTAETNCAR
jgi:chromate transporter